MGKRILIFFEKNKLSTKGGPSGYLYNLNKGISEMGVDYVEFIECQNHSTSTISKFDFFKKIPPIYKFIHFINKKRMSKRKIKDIFFKKTYTTKVDLNDYDLIHFHSSLEMYKIKDSLRDYKGIVVLTTHTPKISHLEILDDLTPSDKKKYRQELNGISDIDTYAFNRADYFIFPTRESLDCYFNTWENFSDIYKKIEKNIYYIPTGIIGKTASIGGDLIRKKYGIPKDAFLICYVGRHNEIKGYDNLKIIGEKYLNMNKDAYFIIAGNEGPLYRLENERWIEIGWTSDSASIIGASDVFVLPNKETYFDLVLLEVLSLGKIAIVSNTGGNKYFSKLKDSTIFTYNTVDECVSLLDKTSRLPKNKINSLGDKNKVLFNSYFSNDVFASRYLETYKAILSKNNKGE